MGLFKEQQQIREPSPDLLVSSKLKEWIELGNHIMASLHLMFMKKEKLDRLEKMKYNYPI